MKNLILKVKFLVIVHIIFLSCFGALDDNLNSLNGTLESIQTTLGTIEKGPEFSYTIIIGLPAKKFLEKTQLEENAIKKIEEASSVKGHLVATWLFELAAQGDLKDKVKNAFTAAIKELKIVIKNVRYENGQLIFSVQYFDQSNNRISETSLLEALQKTDSSLKDKIKSLKVSSEYAITNLKDDPGITLQHIPQKTLTIDSKSDLGFVQH